MTTFAIVVSVVVFGSAILSAIGEMRAFILRGLRVTIAESEANQ